MDRHIDYSIIFLDVHNNFSWDPGVGHFGRERVKLHSMVDLRVIVYYAFLSNFTFWQGWSLSRITCRVLGFHRLYILVVVSL